MMAIQEQLTQSLQDIKGHFSGFTDPNRVWRTLLNTALVAGAVIIAFKLLRKSGGKAGRKIANKVL